MAEGGAPNVLFAATDPERVHSIVWNSPSARMLRSPDYPWGVSPEYMELFEPELEQGERWRGRKFGRSGKPGTGASLPITSSTCTRGSAVTQERRMSPARSRGTGPRRTSEGYCRRSRSQPCSLSRKQNPERLRRPNTSAR
jgi:hypothetical protein